MRIPAADRAMAFLGYLPLLFFLPVRFRRQSIFAQFHGRQSFVLFLLFVVVAAILGAVLFFLENPADWLATALFGLLYADLGVYLGMMLIGMIKVLLGERYRMPVVADVALWMKL